MEQSYYQGANERILNRVPEVAKRILDVGCAAGRLGEILKKERPDREVWGIEAIHEVAAEAKERLDHVIIGDVEQMDPYPLPERYFDCLICGDVLEHLRDPQTVLTRLRKHLTPGATLITNVPNIGHWSVVAGLLQGKFEYADKGLLDRTHLRFFTPESLKNMLWEAGYLVADEEHLEIRHFYDQFGNPTPGDPPNAIGQAAASIGLDPGPAERNAAVYQQLFVAKPVPDPYTEPGKMAALDGPHIGKLGQATKRCSVVVLTYNSMKTIERCLNSVLPTLGSNDELILVDNASQDGTPEYLEALADRRSKLTEENIKVIQSEENTGFSRGCNIGMLASKGEHIVLLNPDTEVWPGWIEGLLAPFQNPRVGATGPLSDNVCGAQFAGLHVPSKGMISKETLAHYVNSCPKSQPAAPSSQLSTKLLIGFCLVLRRDLLDSFGLLEEACFLGADDLEISWRLRTLGFRLEIATGTFVAHECGGSFGTISSEEKASRVSASDASLFRKLREYYESEDLPSSRQLWGSDIFLGAMSG